MFDLEEAIRAWRRSASAALPSAEVLDELESHLREEIDRTRERGVQESEAFGLAVRSLGDPRILGTEFDVAVRPAWRIAAGQDAPIRTRGMNVAAATATVLGLALLGFFAFYLYYLQRHVALSPRPFPAIAVVQICGTSAVCLLTLHASLRYWRFHQRSAARGVLAFLVFFGWLIISGGLEVTLRRLQVFDAFDRQASLARLALRAATLVPAFLLWLSALRRLNRCPAPGVATQT